MISKEIIINKKYMFVYVFYFCYMYFIFVIFVKPMSFLQVLSSIVFQGTLA